MNQAICKSNAPGHESKELAQESKVWMSTQAQCAREAAFGGNDGGPQSLKRHLPPPPLTQPHSFSTPALPGACVLSGVAQTACLAIKPLNLLLLAQKLWTRLYKRFHNIMQRVAPPRLPTRSPAVRTRLLLTHPITVASSAKTLPRHLCHRLVQRAQAADPALQLLSYLNFPCCICPSPKKSSIERPTTCAL